MRKQLFPHYGVDANVRHPDRFAWLLCGPRLLCATAARGNKKKVASERERPTAHYRAVWCARPAQAFHSARMAGASS